MFWGHFFIEGYYCYKCAACRRGDYLLCKKFSYVEDPWAWKISGKLHRALVWLDGKTFDLVFGGRLYLWWCERKLRRTK